MQSYMNRILTQYILFFSDIFIYWRDSRSPRYTMDVNINIYDEARKLFRDYIKVNSDGWKCDDDHLSHRLFSYGYCRFIISNQITIDLAIWCIYARV